MDFQFDNTKVVKGSILRYEACYSHYNHTYLPIETMKHFILSNPMVDTKLDFEIKSIPRGYLYSVEVPCE